MSSSDERNQKGTTRPSPRLERIAQILQRKLEAEPQILDELVTDVAKGGAHMYLWSLLHEAARRDTRVAELGVAYDALLASNKLKVLPTSAQADVLTQAGIFFAGTAGNPTKARSVLQRALWVAPTHTPSFDRLASLLESTGDSEPLLDLYFQHAHAKSAVADKLAILARGARIAGDIAREQSRSFSPRGNARGAHCRRNAAPAPILPADRPTQPWGPAGVARALLASYRPRSHGRSN